MRRSTRIAVSMLLACCCTAWGQTSAASSSAGTQQAPQTTSELANRQNTDLKPPGLDQVVLGVYDIISGPKGQQRDPDKFRALFVKDVARLMVVRHDPKTGQDQLVVMTTDDFITRAFPHMQQDGFFEREVARRTERFGNIVHVWSTYESRYTAQDPKPFQRGINSFELINEGQGWKVLLILWQGERPDAPIPQEYLTSH